MEPEIGKYTKPEETRKKTKDSLVVYATEDIKTRIQNHASERGETLNDFGKRAIETTMALDDMIVPELCDAERTRIRLRLNKGKRAHVKAHAKRMGENMSDFINRAMVNLMELDHSFDEMRNIERWEQEHGKV